MTGTDDPESIRQLIPEDRRRVIASLVREQGSVRGSDLVQLLGVTDETIRRDLHVLAEAGAVKRARGGAVAIRPSDEASTDVRLREHAVEKIDIGAYAAGMIADGTRIILDSGTTTLCIARAMGHVRNVTVVTTAVTHAAELIGRPDTTVVMTGGVVRPMTYGATGELAVATLREVHVDQLFLAIHSVSVKGGLTYPSFEEVETKRAMIDAADQVVLVADHSKFGRETFVRVAPITAVHTIVTTSGIEPDEVARIRDLGIDVVIAPRLTERSLGTGA